MAREVIKDHDIPRLERRRELGFDVDLEDLLGHRPVDDPGSGQPIAAQACYEGLRLPMTERCASLQALTLKRPASQARHFRRGRRLVDEDKPVRLLAHARLAMQPPSPPGLANIIASALRRQQLFFYIESPLPGVPATMRRDAHASSSQPRASPQARAW